VSIHLGDVPANSTLYIPFATYAGSTGASVTLTGLAVTDVEIYKNGSTTQRASDAGYALLDTDGIDFDGITGIHGFSVDLSDDTTAGFYSVGGFYWVVVSAVTVDSQTVNFIAATFRIRAAEAVAGTPKVDVDAWLGTAAATPTTAGVPEVDVAYYAGLPAVTAADRAVVFETTIASVTSQTIWVLTDGPSVDDAVNEYVIDVYDAANAYEFSTGHYGADYVGASKTLTANAAPAFTVAAGDKVVFRPKSHVWAVRGNMTGSAASVTGNVGGSVASVLAVGPGAITAASHEVGAITANAVAADALGASELSAGACEKIADIVLRRLMTNVEASASGDTPGVGSLYGLVQQMQESNLVDNAGFLTVYKTDGTTELGQKAVTTDAAGEPVTGIS
jgi:hypothetical protein